MDRSHPPMSFGVFKPVGHVVIALRGPGRASEAAAALRHDGFDDADITRYDAAQMRAQVDAEKRTASPLASIGQDMNLVYKQGELADAGCDFLVVQASDAGRVERVTAIARRAGAASAQRYGRFVVEELIAGPPGDPQSPESSETGLDLDVGRRLRD